MPRSSQYGPLDCLLIIGGKQQAIEVSIRHEFDGFETGIEWVRFAFTCDCIPLEPTITAWMRQFRFGFAGATAYLKHPNVEAALTYGRSVTMQDIYAFHKAIELSPLRYSPMLRSV